MLKSIPYIILLLGIRHMEETTIYTFKIEVINPGTTYFGCLVA